MWQDTEVFYLLIRFEKRIFSIEYVLTYVGLMLR